MSMMFVKNMRVHYREQGDRRSPVLLFVHGLGCSLKYWACLFEAEEFSDYRMVALDLPGFGLSEKIEQYDYHLSSQADLIAEFVRALNIREFRLVGHSMGGAIAILLAHKLPHLVRHLLVIEPNLNAKESQLSRRIVEYTETAFIQQYEQFRDGAIATVKSWFVNFHQRDLDEYIEDLLKTTAISMYRSAASLIETTQDNTLIQQFQQLALPKHFFIGEETHKIRPIPEVLRNSDIQAVVVPGVGHMMMVDDPVLFTKTLAATLQ